MNGDRHSGGHAPFFINLIMNDLFIHNCMLEYRDSTNVMSLNIMNEFGLKTTRPYKSVCGIESKEINVCNLIKDLKVSLFTYLYVSILMDVVIIYVPDSWGMLVSRKCATTLGGSIQMDLS
jgi:hypothetical protein